MALRATWQRHAGPRGAYAACLYLYLYSLHIVKGIQPSVDRKGIQPIRSSGIINPTVLFNFFHVGLCPTQCFNCRPCGARLSVGSAEH